MTESSHAGLWFLWIEKKNRINLLFIGMLIMLVVCCSKDLRQQEVLSCQVDYVRIRSNVTPPELDTTSQVFKSIVGKVEEPLIEINFWFNLEPFENYLEFKAYLQFLWVPCSEGIYYLADTNQLGRNFASYGHAIDRDLGGYIYDIMDDQDSYLQIVSLDTVNHRIHARFEAHFRRTYEGPWNYDFPEEVHFTDCEFCLEYEEL